MQFYYEHVHIMSGLPWWSSILLASLLYRLGVLAYPNMVTSDQMARTKAVAPLMSQLSARQREAFGKSDQMATMQAQREMSLLRQSAGISFKKTMGFFGLQAFLGYGTFHLMREMASLPVPGLETQGFGWITDLTVPDPYFILPLALGVTMHLAFKFGGAAGSASEFAPPTPGGAEATGHMRTLLLYGMPGIISMFMLWMPACLQLSFASTSVLGILQGRLMMQPWFRQRFGLYPLNASSSPSNASGPKVIDVQNVTPRNLNTRVMDGYQAPTVAGVARALPSHAVGGGKGGVLSAVTKPFTPIAKFFTGIKKEALDGMAKMGGNKDAKTTEYLRRAAEHESRRKREMEEDRQARDKRARRGGRR